MRRHLDRLSKHGGVCRVQHKGYKDDPPRGFGPDPVCPGFVRRRVAGVVFEPSRWSAEQSAERPMNKPPRRIRASVVPWWMCARSWRKRVEYIFSWTSMSSRAWYTQSLVGA